MVEDAGYEWADKYYYPLLKHYALQHRSVPTQAEEVLWELVRGNKLGYHFRRQHIIDKYIADLVCLDRRLIVEIDGLIHQLPDNKENDEIRTKGLESLGFKVVRFTNEEVLFNTENVLIAIKTELDLRKSIKELTTEKNKLSDLSSPFGGQGALPYDPFSYTKRETMEVSNIGASHVPIVIADLSKLEKITHESLQSIGYSYNEATDKWSISDTAADYVFTGHHKIDFALPGTLKVIVYPGTWLQIAATEVQQKQDASQESLLDKYFPIFEDDGYVNADLKSSHLNFVMVDCFNDASSVNDFTYLDQLANDPKGSTLPEQYE